MSAKGPLSLALLVALWAALSSLAASPLFPTPWAVALACAQLSADGSLPAALGLTAVRLAFGYGLAIALGVPLGLIVARSRPLSALVSPLLLGTSSVPSICWLPLAILWFGLSEAAIQSVVIVGALVPVAMATDAAVRHTPDELERAARTMGASGARLLATVTLPAALPGIVSGAKVGWTFALRALLAAELLFVSGGLGQLLETGRDVGDTRIVLGVVVVLLALSRASEWLLFARLERLVARRWGVVA
jgi:NitT/TauT family transport system permease protein